MQISGQLQSVLKAVRLFDYNRDGKIQRHELRRILENFCFKLSDAQFDKWVYSPTILEQFLSIFVLTIKSCGCWSQAALHDQHIHCKCRNRFAPKCVTFETNLLLLLNWIIELLQNYYRINFKYTMCNVKFYWLNEKPVLFPMILINLFCVQLGYIFTEIYFGHLFGFCTNSKWKLVQSK